MKSMKIWNQPASAEQLLSHVHNLPHQNSWTSPLTSKRICMRRLTDGIWIKNKNVSKWYLINPLSEIFFLYYLFSNFFPTSFHLMLPLLKTSLLILNFNSCFLMSFTKFLGQSNNHYLLKKLPFIIVKYQKAKVMYHIMIPQKMYKLHSNLTFLKIMFVFLSELDVTFPKQIYFSNLQGFKHYHFLAPKWFM